MKIKCRNGKCYTPKSKDDKVIDILCKTQKLSKFECEYLRKSLALTN